ncbi:MAG: MFS transporter [Gemmatimonadota bacterium]
MIYRPPTRLLNRNFLLLWQGQLVSLLGTQIYRIAMVLWIRDATGSATVMGMLLAVSAAPGILLSPFAGTFADRHSRRAILVVSDIVDGVGVLAVAGVLLIWPGHVTLALTALFVQSAAAAVSSAFFGPAAIAALPDLVPTRRLAAANAFIQISGQTVSFVGQSLAGFLYRYVSIVALFVFNGVTFLVSAASESYIRLPKIESGGPPRETPALRVPPAGVQAAPGALAQIAPTVRVDGPGSFLQAMRDGFTYLWGRKGLRNLVLASALLGFFAVWIVTLLPFYVPEVLGVGDEWYGILLAAFAGGSLVGSLAAGLNRLSGARTGQLVVVLFVTASTGYILLGLVSELWIVLGLGFLGGGVSGFNGVTVGTIIQASTPSAIRGRVFGIMGMITGSLAPVGMGLSGIVADLVDLDIGSVYVGCGAAMVVISLCLVSSADFRRFVGQEVGRDLDPAGEVASPGKGSS